MTIPYFTDILQPSEITLALNTLVNKINTLISSQAVGIWVPTFLGDSTPGAPTYIAQDATYELIGRQVTARFVIAATALGGMAGNLNIGGLPFAAAANSPFDTGLCVITSYQGWTGAGGYQYLGASVNVKNIVLGKNGSGLTSVAVPISDLAAPLVMAGICSYRIT